MISQKRKDAFVRARLDNLKLFLGQYGTEDEIRKGIETHFDELLELSAIENQKNFFVIGSSDRRFNYGETVQEKRNPTYKDQSETSISAARFSSELMAQD